MPLDCPAENEALWSVDEIAVFHNIPTVTAWEAIRLYESANEEEVSKLTITEAKTKFGIYPEFRADEGGTFVQRAEGDQW